MAGLLDNIDGDTILSGLLSAGAASGAKGPYLARVAAGLAQGERFRQGRAEQARQRSQDEMQAEYRQLQKRKLEMDMAQQERAGLLESQKATEAQRIDALLRNAGQVRPGMGAGLPAGTLPDDLSMPAQPALQRPGQIDPQYLVQQGAPFERVKQLMEAPNLGRAKVKNIETVSINGKPMKVGIDEFGQQVAQIGMEWKPLQFQDFGGDVRSFDQTNPQAGFTSVGKKSMSFSDQNAAGHLKIARDRFAMDEKKAAADAAGGGYSTKPLPPTAMKMQTEAIDALGTVDNINTMLGGIEKQITDKKLSFGPVSNLYNMARNKTGTSTEESRNFSSFKSSLEKLRNESLRLNAGVQTDGDAQRAWNELFQDINDTDLVKQRLTEIKTLNKRAAELQKLKIDSIRGNYGAAPYEHKALGGEVTPKPSALSPEDAQAREWATKNPMDPRAKQIMQRLGGG